MFPFSFNHGLFSFSCFNPCIANLCLYMYASHFQAIRGVNKWHPSMEFSSKTSTSCIWKVGTDPLFSSPYQQNTRLILTFSHGVKFKETMWARPTWVTFKSENSNARVSVFLFQPKGLLEMANFSNYFLL